MFIYYKDDETFLVKENKEVPLYITSLNTGTETISLTGKTLWQVNLEIESGTGNRVLLNEDANNFLYLSVRMVFTDPLEDSSAGDLYILINNLYGINDIHNETVMSKLGYFSETQATKFYLNNIKNQNCQQQTYD